MVDRLTHAGLVCSTPDSWGIGFAQLRGCAVAGVGCPTTLWGTFNLSTDPDLKKQRELLEPEKPSPERDGRRSSRLPRSAGLPWGN